MISWEIFKGWLYIQLFQFSILILFIIVAFVIVIYQDFKRKKMRKIK